MRVLLTNNTLDFRAGSELYIYDVAVELLNRGHQPIAFSTVLGQVAEKLRAATVPVVDDLTRIGAAPDIIHGQHHFETLLALLSFPNVPAINFCHGWTPIEEQPLIFPRVLRYVAVDHTCRDRLELEHGIAPERISVILNFVNLERFRRRRPLPDVPRRAVAFGHPFGTEISLPILRCACERVGIELDVAGLGSNGEWAEPEKRLGEYDLVFAKARAALEAMAVGAAVVLCGPRGLGPMVTPEEWARLRLLNFGVRALTLPLNTENAVAQIRRYDSSAAARVCALVRNEAALPEAVDRLIAVYEGAIHDFSQSHAEPTRDATAAARYLREWAPIFKGRIHNAQIVEDARAQMAEATRLAARATESEGRGALLEQQLAQLSSDCNQQLRDAWARASESGVRAALLEQQLNQLMQVHDQRLRDALARAQQSQERAAALQGQVAALRQEGDRWCREWERMRHSATWQLSRAVLESAPMRFAAPIVERIGRFIREKNRGQTGRFQETVGRQNRPHGTT